MGQRRPGFESAELFWGNYQEILERKNEKEYLLLEKAGIPRSTMANARARGSFPHVAYIHSLAKVLNIKMEDFFVQPDEPKSLIMQNEQGEIAKFKDDEIVFVPVFPQKVAAGNGQELLESTQAIALLPFLKRMLRGTPASHARALEVRGDSMTGVNIFDGDMIVFVPGEIRGDGIYVLKVIDELLVKRVEFDHISRKLRIMSENPRYPDRIESSDGQTVEVVGKVYGWVHAHPY